MVALRRFVTRAHVGLDDAIGSQWAKFHTEAFATEVIAHMPASASISVRSLAELAELSRLGRTARLGVRFPVTAREFADLVDLANLTTLALWDAEALGSLDVLNEARRLQSLSFDRRKGIRGASGLTDLPALTFFGLYETDLADLADLPTLPRVTRAFLYDPLGTAATHRFFCRFPALKTLDIYFSPATRHPPGLVDLAPAASLPLERLTVEGPANLRGAELFPPGVVTRITRP